MQHEASHPCIRVQLESIGAGIYARPSTCWDTLAVLQEMRDPCRTFAPVRVVVCVNVVRFLCSVVLALIEESVGVRPLHYFKMCVIVA